MCIWGNYGTHKSIVLSCPVSVNKFLLGSSREQDTVTLLANILIINLCLLSNILLCIPCDRVYVSSGRFCLYVANSNKIKLFGTLKTLIMSAREYDNDPINF